MTLAVAQPEPVRLEAVPAVHLHRHPRPLLLEVKVKQVGIHHATQDQCVEHQALGLEVWVQVLDGRDVVLDHVVPSNHISLLEERQPLLRILVELGLSVL